MKCVESLTELKTILNSVEGKKTLTNCYFFGNELVELVNKGILYYKSIGNNLFLFKNKFEGQFFEMYYFIIDEHLAIDMVFEVPIVLEIPYRGDLKLIQREIDYLTKSNFILHINRDLMFLNNPELITKKVSIDNCFVKPLEDINFTKIVVDSIKHTFDFYTGDIMSSEEIKESIVNKEILAVYSGETLTGFLRFYTKNEISWIGHIIIFNQFVGKGLGKLLVYEYLKHQTERGIRSFQHWVVTDNDSALKLYEHFGFTKMNKSSISLIKK